MNWIEVFRTGTHTDSSGTSRSFSAQDLDRMVATLDPKRHEPPLVLGHPRTDAPAFGWVCGLKRSGDVLLASFRDVPDQVREWVASGRYKKRSISLYPDGRLRHVGLLGAMPPAVQGLADFRAFADGAEEAEGEYSEDVEVDMDKVKELEAKLAEAQAELERLRSANGQDAAQAKDGEIAQLKAELAKTKEAQAAKEAEFAEAQRTARRKELTDKVDGLVAAGKALPAQKGAILAFAERLDGGGELEFSEGAGKKPLVQHFFDFLGQALPDTGLAQDYSEAARAGAGRPAVPVDYSKISNKT